MSVLHSIVDTGISGFGSSVVVLGFLVPTSLRKIRGPCFTDAVKGRYSYVLNNVD